MCQSCYDTKRPKSGYRCHECHNFYVGISCPSCRNEVKREQVPCGEDCRVEWKPALSPFVATMLKKFPTKCKFTHNGCQVFIILKDLEVHEVDCDYRNINCPFLDCNAKDVSFISLGDHLVANHGNWNKIGKNQSKDFVPMLDQGPAVWIPKELGFRNRSFFTEVHREYFLISRLVFWIYFHGTPEEAIHYSYRVKITGENGIELTFKGNVHSLDETKKVIMAKKDSFILFDCQARLFQVGGRINFEITLDSDKEEIKYEDVESGISEDDEQ
jgi:hypothetical protein